MSETPALAGNTQEHNRARRKLIRRKLIRRAAIAIALVFASLIPPFVVKDLPLTGDLERLAHDVYRAALAPKVGMVPEIAIIEYDDVTARETRKTSPIDRALVAKAIQAADAGGAKAIGVDFFFAQPTDDEDALVEVLNAVSTPIFMVYADPEADGGLYWSAAIGGESKAYQDQLWARLSNAPITRVSPMIGTGPAKVARRWPGRRGQAQIPLAAAMAGYDNQAFGYQGSIAFTRMAEKRERMNDTYAAGMFPTFSLTAFRDDVTAESLGQLFADRYVLIGLDIFNADRLATPVSRIEGEANVPGVAIHAHMLRQALGGDFARPFPAWAIFVIGLIFAVAGGCTAHIDRRVFLIGGLITGQMAVIAAAPALLFWAGYDLFDIPATGWAITWLIALTGFGYIARMRTSAERAFAQDALGKYLPATVAREILDDPAKLSLEGEERNLFMLFTDLEGFTRISHSQPPRTTARILNHYLDEMSEIILSFSGTIDKFVGDAIVAFWGAPIATADDAHNAVSCALALHECAERLRAELAEEGESLGRTRIGLHCGRVIVGNFGGRQRIQYTALGDAMNTAARLEGANKYLGSAILVSGDVRDAAPDIAYCPLGKIVLSGVDTPIPVFEPVVADRADFAVQLRDAMTALDRGDDTAADRLRALSLQHPSSRTLARLAERCEMINGGKPYVLESK